MKGTDVDKNSNEFQFVNYAAMTVIEMMKLVPSREEKYNLLLEFIRKINPEYAESVNKVCDTPEKRENIVSDVEQKNWIPLVLGNFMDPIEIVDFINNKAFVTCTFGSPQALRKGYPK